MKFMRQKTANHLLNTITCTHQQIWGNIAFAFTREFRQIVSDKNKQTILQGIGTGKKKNIFKPKNILTP